MDKQQLNEIYYPLDLKQAELNALFRGDFRLESSWYNGHYHKDETGNWCRESYPIPVIGVKGLCDIEVTFDKISISTKLKRDAALGYPFEKLAGYEFEAYGVENYLTDFYHPGQTAQDLGENIRTCNEKEIGFSFVFPLDRDGKQIFEFVKLLQQEGFYY